VVGEGAERAQKGREKVQKELAEWMQEIGLEALFAQACDVWHQKTGKRIKFTVSIEEGPGEIGPYEGIKPAEEA
jgi:hypothetical protein